MLSPAIVAGMVLMSTAFVAQVQAQAQAQAPIKLAILGDSLSAGYGLPLEAAFPAKLQKALREKGHKVDILNAGVSGDTTSGGRDRLDWSIPDGTEAVLVELGANDALRGLDPKVTKTALEDIIKKLQARKIAVMLAGMVAPPNYGPDYAARFNPIYADLAKAHDVPLYPFFLDGVASEAKLNQPDGIHPTAEGIDIIVARILPSVEAFLNKVSADRAKKAS
jgi:acyl-CoA thioesterase I